MSEKSAKELKKLLFNDKKNGFDFLSDEELETCNTFAEGYKDFLFNCKTEREVAAWAKEAADASGLRRFFEFGQPLSAGEKVYVANRGKAIILCVKGKKPINEGVRIAAAHIDSPRVDLKQCPVYEDGSMAFFKTHYYGGIKK